MHAKDGVTGAFASGLFRAAPNVADEPRETIAEHDNGILIDHGFLERLVMEFETPDAESVGPKHPKSKKGT